MLMAWIESHQAVGQHPKTLALAHLLGVSLPTAVGHLHYLWWWALDYAPDGELKRHGPTVVAHACLWRGKPQRLWEALTESGFLEAGQSGARIHDWGDYAGKLIDRRASNRQRMRAARAAHGADGVHVTSGVPVHTRVELPDQPDRTEPTGTPQPPLERGRGSRRRNGVDPEQRMDFSKFSGGKS
jgi:hypothetical protein